MHDLKESLLIKYQENMLAKNHDNIKEIVYEFLAVENSILADSLDRKNNEIITLKAKISEMQKNLEEAQMYRSNHWEKFQNETKNHAKTKELVKLLEESVARINNEKIYLLSRRLKNTKSTFKKIGYIYDILFKSRLLNVDKETKKNESSSFDVDSIKQPEEKNKIEENRIKKDKLNVAIVCDEFTFKCFEHEFNPIVITPENWKDKFLENNIDLFFCESAWSGTDSEKRPWKGKIYASTNFAKENRIEILEILQFCKNKEIPTVFWNKEDPTHYEDRKHDFVKTALNFDYIFTTAEECVDKYKNDYNHKNVYSLPFATQPKIFNPINNSTRKKCVTFAGGWYENHTTRCSDMSSCFEAIIESGNNLEIYDRFYNGNDPLHKFPERFKKYIYPNVDFDSIPSIYKSSIFSLTINTVKNSNTMLARRAFELASSGTIIVSNSSKALDNYFEKKYINLEKNPKSLVEITDKDIDKLSKLALYECLKNHTYKKRFEKIKSVVGIQHNEPIEDLTVVFKCKNISELKKTIAYYKQELQTNTYTKLLLILSSDFNNTEIQKIFLTYNKDDINLVSDSYISNYGVNFDQLIETKYFLYLEDYISITGEKILEKLLHYLYLEDEIIKLSPDGDYRISTKEEPVSIIGKKEFFNKIYLNNLLNIKFYRVEL